MPDEQGDGGTRKPAADTPTEISVSMVAAPCRALVQAALWKGQAAYVTTGAARVSESHCQYWNCNAGTIAIAITGTAGTTAVVSRCRSGISSSRSSPARPLPGSGSVRGGVGALFDTGVRWLPWAVLAGRGFVCVALVARLHRAGHLTPEPVPVAVPG